MKKWTVLFFTMVIVLCLSACGCKHEWQDATCTSPQRCKLCNKTEGEMLPHKWMEATCTSPKTCSVCNETEGNLIDHMWKEATCQNLRTCETCGTTEGEKSAHVPGEWVLREPNYVDAEQIKAKECTVCGEVVKQEWSAIDTLHDGVYVIPSVEEFGNRLQKLLKSYTGTNVKTLCRGVNDHYGIVVLDNDGNYAGSLLFTDAQGEMILEKNKDARKSFGKMVGAITDSDAAIAVTIGMIDAMLPSLSFEQVKDKASDLILAGEIRCDGIKFLFSDVGGGGFLVGFVIE